MAHVLAVAALCLAGALAQDMTDDAKQYPHAEASSTRGGRVAANAIDGRVGTFWQSESPAKDTWLQYERGEPGRLTEVSIGNWIDSRYAAADGLIDFNIEASDDGTTWTNVLAVRGEKRWRAGETRKYYVQPEDDDGEVLPKRWFYRLVARRVPGRARGDSHVTLREVRFLMDDEATPACEAIDAGKLLVNVTANGFPEDGPTVSTPNYEIQVAVDIEHLAGKGEDGELVSLKGLRVPILFSRGVRSWNGTWARAPAKKFRVRCYGGAIEAPRGQQFSSDLNTDACESYLNVDVGEAGIFLEFTGGTLCPGCTFTGADEGVVFALQHRDYRQLDASSIEVLESCSNSSAAATKLPPKPLPLPDLHPVCQVFAADAAPECPSEQNLSMLNATVAFVQEEKGNSSINEQGPRELMVQFELYNTGRETVSLAGVSVEFDFDRDVFVESFYEYVPAEPEEFQLVCFWMELDLPNGLRKVGDVSACEYTTIEMASNGKVRMTFNGGSICPGCFLTGPSAGSGPAFAVKHVSYFQLAEQAMRPNATLSCKPLSIEGDAPAWCADELSAYAAA